MTNTKFDNASYSLCLIISLKKKEVSSFYTIIEERFVTGWNWPIFLEGKNFIFNS